MADPRLEALACMVSPVEGAACWLARLALRAAIGGGVAGVMVVWWFAAGDQVDEWWPGTVGSLLVLLLCLAPPGRMTNVRLAFGGARRAAGRAAPRA